MNVSTVGELADYLAGQPRDRKIVMAKDAEGNGYSPLAHAAEGMYEATSTWAGEAYMTPEDLAEWMARPDNPGYTDEDAPPDTAERVVFLGPVN